MSHFANPTFEKLCRYLGWGDPTSQGLWFIGLEEGGNAPSLDKISAWFVEHSDLVRDGDIMYQRDVEPDPSPDRFKRWPSLVPYYTARIACEVSDSGLDVYSYRQKCLWRPAQGVFNANVYPLQKPSWASWPQECIEVSGFTQWTQYDEFVASTRYKWLRDYFRNMKPQAVVCFGKTGWPAFRSALNLADHALSQDRIEIYSDEQVLLVPFFDNRHMHHDMASQIAAILKKWKVAVP